jgi:hypothetical protein
MNLNDHIAMGLRTCYLRQTDAIGDGYSRKGGGSHQVPRLVLKATFIKQLTWSDFCERN